MIKLSKQEVEKFVSSDALYSLRSLKPPDAARVLFIWIIGIMLILIIILFLPWQQNIRGNGKITAFNPMNRPQTVETIIAGRISKWHVREGIAVLKGDTIITLTEVKEKYFDPMFLQRMREQIEAKTNSLNSKDNKAKALERQILALKQGMQNKLDQSKAKLEAERIRFNNAENQYQRNKKLFESGNIPLTKFQDIEYKYQGSKADLQNSEIELSRVEAEYLDKISKAESDLNSTRADLFDGQGDLLKYRNEYANMQIRNEQYQILAPQDGTIVKAMKAGVGETIKEGEAVCTIMPSVSDVAVEMYVKAMNVPLLSRGREVRIQFDGWPSLQFSGWPSVSVGTFGGTIEVIDYINSKPGEFRILVIPNKNDEPWPKQLRVGSGIKAWAMLDDVPIWYELWRQLNGFPPSLYEEPLDEVVNKKSYSENEMDSKK